MGLEVSLVSFRRVVEYKVRLHGGVYGAMDVRGQLGELKGGLGDQGKEFSGGQAREADGTHEVVYVGWVMLVWI